MKRSLAVGLVVAAILAGGGAGWALTHVDHSAKHKSTPPTTLTKASVQVISYVTKARPQGLTLYKATDVSQLTGATDAFKQFIAGAILKVHKDAGKGACGGAPIGIDVFAYSTNGFASGAADVCGGYQALWGIKNGAWTQLIGTQGGWVCADLHRLGAPKGILAGEQCADAANRSLVDYQG